MNLPVEREALKPYLNKKVVLTGHFRRFDTFHDYHSRREYPCAILESCFLENGDTMVADHLWVHRAEELRGLEPELDLGERVRLTATVRDYQKRKLDQNSGKMTTVTSYFVDRPEGIQLPDRVAVAIKAANGSRWSVGTPEAKPIPIQCNGEELTRIRPMPTPSPEPAIAAEPLDYCRLIKDVKALAKRCGGLGRLRDLVQLLLEE